MSLHVDRTAANENISEALEATDRVMDIMSAEMEKAKCANHNKIMAVSQIGIISMLTAISSQLDILISVEESK